MLFIGLTVASLSGAVAANTWAVDGSLTDNSGCVAPTFQCKTIQAAVTAATAGDTISVKDGTYTENVSINKNVILTSENGRASTTVTGISGVGALGTIVVTGNTTGVQIGDTGKGFTIVGIDNGAPGIENAALYFQGPHSGAIVRDNEIRAMGDGGLLTEYGVAISNFTITGNEFSGKTFTGATPGDCGFGSQFSVANVPRQLMVMGNGGGNAASASATNIIFTNNNVTGTAGGSSAAGGCEAVGQGNTLVTLDVANSTITGNIFAGTTARFGTSLRVRRPGTTISGNTFNSSGLAPATGHLFIQNSPVNAALINGNTFDKGVWVENASGGTIGLGIQGFVTAVPSGTTINILNGTYPGQVVIDGKDVTLLGESLNAVIQATASMPACFTTSASNRPVVCIKNSASTVIDTLTIDGAGLGNTNNRFMGVGFRNAGGTVQNSAVKDIRDTPFSGAQHGVAIYAFNDDTIARTLTILDNTITGFQKNAMALNGGATTPLVVNVQGNQITGKGSTNITAQNGIQVWADMGTGTIGNNTVADIGYDNSASATKWVASSILNFDAEVTISNNTVTNAQTGIYSINGGVIISDNDIDVVKVGDSGYGIIATDPPNAIPAPFDAESLGARTASTRAATSSVLNVNLSGNSVILTGGNSSTVGVEFDAGYGADDLDVTATGNTVSGFAIGFGVYACTSSCSPGLFTDVDLNFNNISGNTIGVDSDVSYLTVDATNNDWGVYTEPAVAALVSGTGAVDYDPFLGAAVTTVQSASISNGENVVLGGATATYSGGGSATVTLAQYSGNPAGTNDGGGILAGGSYYDIHVANITEPAATISLQFAAADGEILRYFNGSNWNPIISNDGTIPVASGGSVTIVFGPNSLPRLIDLTGTAISSGNAEAIEIQFADASIVQGQQIAAAVVAKSTNLAGVEVHLTFNAAALQVSNIILGGDLAADVVGANDYNNAGGVGTGTIDFAFSQLRPRVAATGDDILVATIIFTAQNSFTGATPVGYSAASETIFSNPDGVKLGGYLDGGGSNTLDAQTDSITIVQGATVGGTVLLQGRTQQPATVVIVQPGSGLQGTTSAAGAFSIAGLIPGGPDGVASSGTTYEVKASFAGYLTALKTGVDPNAGNNTLATVTLLGGDATRDQTINIQDLALIGSNFGATGAPLTGNPAKADINGDNAVNVLDLTMAGSNFGQAGPISWP